MQKNAFEKKKSFMLVKAAFIRSKIVRLWNITTI